MEKLRNRTKMSQINQSSAFFRNYLITAFLIGFVAPVSIISYCYTKIITTMNLVHRRAKQANAKISKSTSMASNSRKLLMII